ncbi:MAG TPA: hypothetical protein VFQ51_03335 [Vicinamibacteria bacterium]|nr:hypothetical protein [Vicinamibacteria bacterium]
MTLSRQDDEQLRLLSIGHYVVAGLEALSGFFPVFHLAMGIWMLTSPELHRQKDAPPIALFAGLFIAAAVAWMVTSWAMAVCLFLSARYLKQRRRRMFCLVVGAVAAMMCMPFGTVLGVFTIIVLVRPSVMEAFDVSEPTAVPPELK